MALASLIAFSGPKKVLNIGPTLSNGPHNGFCPLQNHYVLRHINTRYINSHCVCAIVRLIREWSKELRDPYFTLASNVSLLQVVACHYSNIWYWFDSVQHSPERIGSLSKTPSTARSPTLSRTRSHLLSASLLLPDAQCRYTVQNTSVVICNLYCARHSYKQATSSQNLRRFRQMNNNHDLYKTQSLPISLIK